MHNLARIRLRSLALAAAASIEAQAADLRAEAEALLAVDTIRIETFGGSGCRIEREMHIGFDRIRVLLTSENMLYTVYKSNLARGIILQAAIDAYGAAAVGNGNSNGPYRRH